MMWTLQPASRRKCSACAVSTVVLGIVVLVGYLMMSSQSQPVEHGQRPSVGNKDVAFGMDPVSPNGCEISGSVVYASYDPTVLDHEWHNELQFGSTLGPYQVLARRLEDALRVYDAEEIVQLLGQRRVYDAHSPADGQEPFSSIEAWMNELRVHGKSIAISEVGRDQDIWILGILHGDLAQPQPISIAVDMTGDCSMTVYEYHHQEPAHTSHIATWTDMGLLVFGGQQFGAVATDDIAKRRPAQTIEAIMLEDQSLLGPGTVQIATVPWPIDNNENDLPEMQALWSEGRLMAVVAIESSIAVLTYDATIGRWERSAALPGSDQAVGGVVWTGHEMLMAGGGPFEPSQAAWLYEKDVDRWERIADLPIGPIEQLRGVVGDDVAYFVGVERDIVPSQGEVVAYDLALEKWKVLPLPVSLPSDGYSQSAALHVDLESSSPLAGRDEFQQLLWTGSELVYFYVTLGEYAATTFAEPCRDHRTAYAMTESGDIEDAASSVLLFYDPKQDSWRKSSPMPADYPINQTLAWTGTHVVLWGGKSSTAHLGCEGHVSVRRGYLYDVAADQWQPMSPSPLGPRCGHSTTWTGSHIIIFGGTPSCDGNTLALSDGAIYDPLTDSWASFRVESRTGW